MKLQRPQDTGPGRILSIKRPIRCVGRCSRAFNHTGVVETFDPSGCGLKGFARINMALDSPRKSHRLRDIDIDTQIEKAADWSPILVFELQIVSLQNDELVRRLHHNRVIDSVFCVSIKGGEQNRFVARLDHGELRGKTSSVEGVWCSHTIPATQRYQRRLGVVETIRWNDHVGSR